MSEVSEIPKMCVLNEQECQSIKHLNEINYMICWDIGNTLGTNSHGYVDY